MKRFISVLCLCVFIVSALISGCSSSSKKDMATSTQAAGGSSYSKGSYEVVNESGNISYDSETLQQDDIRKIIKTGEIAVEVKDVDEAYNEIKLIVDGVGGSEFNKSYTIHNDYKRMRLVLKIPPYKLEEFQQKLTECVGDAHISRIDIRSEDISSEYYDVQARLESYIASRDQIRELLSRAQTVEEVLKIQSELTRLQAEIDSMQGRINMWDKLVDMATITLYIDEEQDPLRHTRTIGWKFSSGKQVWLAMRNGFVNTVNTLYNIIIWIFVAIVSLLPLLIPAGIVAWFVFRRRKKNSKKQLSE